MKSSKPKKLTAKLRSAMKLQVQEYVDCYYPEMGKVDVYISPRGTLAGARVPKNKKRKS